MMHRQTLIIHFLEVSLQAGRGGRVIILTPLPPPSQIFQIQLTSTKEKQNFTLNPGEWEELEGQSMIRETVSHV